MRRRSVVASHSANATALPYFQNPFKDFHENTNNPISSNGKLQPEFLEKLTLMSERLLNHLTKSAIKMKEDDFSVYSGRAGISLLFLLLSRIYKRSDFIEAGLILIRNALAPGRIKGLGGASFLAGAAGPLALGAVMQRKVGNVHESEELVQRVLAMLPQVVRENSSMPDDLFCGRAGYLHALLFINKHIAVAPVETGAIKEVVAAILRSGFSRAAKKKPAAHVDKAGDSESPKNKEGPPLLFQCGGRAYVGAAHGLTGVLLPLMQALERGHIPATVADVMIRPAVEYLVARALPGGRFPSRFGCPRNASDASFVQWCHGSPGVVPLLALAHQLFGERRFLRLALRCGDAVWRTGLLRKGCGLCHGAAGNAYAFLALYRATKDPIHLYRACKFTEWCFLFVKCRSKQEVPSLSLFEGLAGTAYLFFDLLDPENALFPAYDL